MNSNSRKSWHKQDEGSGSACERSSRTAETCPRAVRVDGEVLLLRCWACGTEHCVIVEQCTPEELPLMICSRSNCRMSLFLVNELTIDEQIAKQSGAIERSGLFAALSRLWK
jgi:hypothetical protein